MALQPGTKAPHFTLPDQHGKSFSLTAMKGDRPVVVFFYPKDHTPGCTAEVCSFRDRYEDFQELGAVVVGISSDSSESHRSFAEAHQLPFRLLADKDGKVRRDYEVSSALFGLLPGRETFVIDKQGIIRYRFNSMNPSGHMKRALEALQSQK